MPARCAAASPSRRRAICASALDAFIRRESPLSEPVTKPKATWVEPVIEAEIAYSTLTENKLLRETVFKGVREDQESPAAPRSRGTPVRSEGRQPKTGVPPENILQLLPDAVTPSKEELRAYWAKVWKRALPHLGRRPLKLVRYVRGTTFYHIGKLPPVSEAVHSLTIEKREGGEGTRLWIDDLAGLLGLVEIGAVELHPWNARIDDIEHPERLVFDLDPGEGLGWDFVIETALTLRRMLKDEGLDPWPKLTGGKGLHLMAPLGGGGDRGRDLRDYSRLVESRACRASWSRPSWRRFTAGSRRSSSSTARPASWCSTERG
jgi:bifunctional non-homologous end joining protein LigD